MKISEFIQQQVLLPRLQRAGVLVVYDPDRRYRALCLALEAPQRRVIDASESSILAREAALAALQELGELGGGLKELLIYVPARPPRSDEEKQRDPFSVYGACGAVFPAGDGDEYLSLCLRAKPDHALELRRLFAADPDPAFAVIDALGGGAGWPTLQALLGVESARDILLALLAPSEAQTAALQGNAAWPAEARALLQRTLGLCLLTHGETWSPIAAELWRYLLFSEFVFDLPAPLPAALANVPRAPAEAQTLVFDLCEHLRNDLRTRDLYITRAEEIERELDLPTLCAGVADLGVRETFPFEERTGFAQAVEALRRDNVDSLRAGLLRHDRSIWVARGENQAQWLLLQAAAALIETCRDCERQLPEHARSQVALLDAYAALLREADRRQRELEGTIEDVADPAGDTAEVIDRARAAYRALADAVQALFIRHLEKAGWPPAGSLANSDVFDRVVAPLLQEKGRRVVLMLIDALRYELGVELVKHLAECGPVELRPACGPLPSVTAVGMAALLPGAGRELQLLRKDGQAVPALGERIVGQVAQRMEVLRGRYGERFAEFSLSDLRGKFEVPAGVDLLVVRSNAIDSEMERGLAFGLRAVRVVFRDVRTAIHKLRARGFTEVVIATDHGFYLNGAAGPGDVCPKPPGDWLNLHGRLLLGDGVADAANYALPAAQLGIRGAFTQAAGPRALVAYHAGAVYMHGGASLPELLLPVLTLRLPGAGPAAAQPPALTLRYKNGATTITTRLPVIELSAGLGDLFFQGALEVLLEAHDKKGKVVGEAKPGGAVNAATRTVSIKPGETILVPLRMAEEFEGRFTVKALNPATLAAFSTLDLETDYMG